MTVSSTADRETFQGNGVTTLFPLPFRFFNNADIVARLVNNTTQATTLLTLGIDYILSGAGEPEVEGNPASSITMLTAPATGFSLFVQRVMKPDQPTDIINQGRFYPEVHEIAFDRLTMLIQQAYGMSANALLRPAGTNYYDALGYQIKNLAEPVDLQDAATKNWAQQYVASILVTGQGPINNAANVIYVFPGGQARVVQDLAGTDGATGVGHLQTTVSRLLPTHPRAYGAVCDGVADDTAAIQAALDASLSVDFGNSGDRYKISAKLNLRNGHVLTGKWPTITQTALQTPMFDCVNKEDISANGLRCIGVKESPYVNSPASKAIAFHSGGGKQINVFGNIFKDFCYSPLMVDQAGEDITFVFNVVEGPGADVLSNPNFRNTTGFTILGKNVTVHGNKIKSTASGGIVGQLSENVTVTSNIIHDIITEHGLYCDTGIFGLTIAKNIISNTVASGVKVQNYDAVGGNSGKVAITGNVINNVTGGDGIQVINTGPTGTPVRCKGLTITGNVVSNVGQDGISHRYTDDAVITGNSISFTGRAGIYEQNHLRSVVRDNGIYRTQAQGVEDILGVGNVIGDNRLNDVGRGGGAVIGSGIHVAGGSEKDIYDNVISGDVALMEYGVFIEDGTQSTMSVWGNRVSGAKTAPMRFKNPPEPLRYFADNVLDGEPLFLYNTIQKGNKGQDYFGTAAPTTGSWRQGDRVVNALPTSGGVTGWVCVVTGTPGTWRSYGAISSS